MGGDGGSIPRREELVRSKQKTQRADRRVANAALWRHCTLSQDRLRPPIVSCRLGRLYNKESVITKLLNRASYNNSADHIKKLKDVRELHLTVNTSHTESTDPLQDASAEFYCPITGLEMCGIHAFVYLWTCGCVFSKKALETVQDKVCMTCGTPFTSDDVILLNPQTDDEIEAARLRLLTYQQSCAATNKAKKRPATTGSSNAAAEPSAPSIEKPPTSAPKEEGPTRPKKSTAETPLLAGSQPMPPPTSAPPPTSSNSRQQPPASGSTRSIQEDPNATPVYKSLFTTSEEAKRQPKAHWVTFNPLYFR